MKELSSDSSQEFQFLLETIKSYAEIGDDTWRALQSISRIKDVSKGQEIVSLGEKSDAIYFVCKGIFLAYVLGGDQGEREVVKNFFDEGRFPASITSMLKNEESNFCMVALEDSVVIEMNFKGYRKILKEKDDFKWFHIQYIERHWLLEREPQELSLLNDEGVARYLNFLEQYPGVIDRVPLYNVASRIGVTPTQLSRIRSKLKR